MTDSSKTVVYQSYRTENAAHWISQCMDSVKKWVEYKGYSYRFYDDVMFTYAPDWYRESVQNNVLLVSDLARLKIAKELLDEGFERVIWMDADMLIFNQAQFDIPVIEQYAFCYESWLEAADNGKLNGEWRVNNSICVFCKGNSFLDFYIQACQDIVQKKTNVGPWYIGTVFLTMLRKYYPFELLTNVGMIGPFLIRAILYENEKVKELFRKVQKHPVYAGNLCGSLFKKNYKGMTFNESDYERLVQLLVDSGGEVIN